MKTTTEVAVPDVQQLPAAGAPVHEEPTTGGSYTRNPATGALMKNEPQPVAQPSQE